MGMLVDKTLLAAAELLGHTSPTAIFQRI